MMESKRRLHLYVPPFAKINFVDKRIGLLQYSSSFTCYLTSSLSKEPNLTLGYRFSRYRRTNSLGRLKERKNGDKGTMRC
jgi:hypothetical protein